MGQHTNVGLTPENTLTEVRKHFLHVDRSEVGRTADYTYLLHAVHDILEASVIEVTYGIYT